MWVLWSLLLKRVLPVFPLRLWLSYNLLLRCQVEMTKISVWGLALFWSLAVWCSSERVFCVGSYQVSTHFISQTQVSRYEVLLAILKLSQEVFCKTHFLLMQSPGLMILLWYSKLQQWWEYCQLTFSKVDSRVFHLLLPHYYPQNLHTSDRFLLELCKHKL